MKFDIGDGPVQREHEMKMREVAHAIDRYFNGPGTVARCGFVLMVFDFAGPADQHRCNYMSNCLRDEIVQLMKEQITAFENQKKEERK